MDEGAEAGDTLRQVLRRLTAFLAAKAAAPGATVWADNLSRAQARCGDRPAELATEVLGFFGGMGSLNDVVFGPGRDRDTYHDLTDELYAAAKAVRARDGPR